ncbi:MULTISPECIES: ABC transporter substrate-binding protein [Variovorax]|jgi:NitT/TauT family transport system substrate-binding protein|uniref:ABC transporter substrate-binding protein n=1 Tax=Variovorax TaxID=34072 RepID=UPI0008AFBE23|nr:MULTISPECIES: ABC transporter substrate-binding protein [Variovorax]UVH57095.1 ABC transporter substrate-binding protein [Variovorax paradoxus]SET52065.1 NitT/TauT family transport system substrate-binding protein [Variovorax sp. OV084]
MFFPVSRRAAVVAVSAALGASLAALPVREARAQQLTPIKFVLDWKLQGIHAWYYLAEDRGYFAAEKLAVTIDQGDGSAAAVTKVMAGAYDAGFGDVNAVIQNAAAKPGAAPVMVYMVYNRAPFALIVKAGSPIRTLKDLEGRTLGSPAGGAAQRMFPLMAARNGVDAGKVKWTSMAPNLQEQMLLKDHVEGSAVFSVTSYMNLVAQGVDPDKDIRWFHYGDHGVDLYGNGVLVSRQLLRDKPQAVAGLVRAVNKAVRDTVADPDAAIAALMKREPLLNQALEKRRLLYTLRTVMLTPEVGTGGIGDVNDERMTRAIGQVKEAFELANAPTAGEVFDRRFLPPLAERKIAAP